MLSPVHNAQGVACSTGGAFVLSHAGTNCSPNSFFGFNVHGPVVGLLHNMEQPNILGS